MKKLTPHFSHQSGAVLIVSLIILLLLTLLGVTSIRTTTMEEKMAGNMRNRDLAFQAAESALREAETAIRNMINTANFYGGSNGAGRVNGYYSAFNPTTNTPDIKAIITSPSTWTDNSKSIEANAVPGVASAPRYIIQHSQHVVPPGGINFGSYGANKAGAEIDYFKIYARGSGGTDNAQVILESNYGMRF